MHVNISGIRAVVLAHVLRVSVLIVGATLVKTLVLCMLPPSGARVKQQVWPISFTKEELRKKLTPAQYNVTQERGTER